MCFKLKIELESMHVGGCEEQQRIDWGLRSEPSFMTDRKCIRMDLRKLRASIVSLFSSLVSFSDSDFSDTVTSRMIGRP